MFYIDAVCNGIPDVPEADPELRARLTRRIKEEGALNVAEDLKELDPEAYRSIDRSNGMRETSCFPLPTYRASLYFSS